ncbi:signal transduction histidine kinase [Ancylobacter aquaticus]|uniref:histidine kinase n=1 Tax=Ancylobacter aquaticus TaxID=100 RepID=A0A4V2PK56_ANCAQ|nr:ATP-binding protein [Ancylobacter aquaticus]TCK31126.1 signal transduction histidine kinase [Ancylobacter aquaticus]
MNTIRTKLTALLVGSVLGVLIVATGLSLLILTPPDFGRMDDAAAVQLGMLIDLAERTRDPVNEGPYGRISSAPAGGHRVEPATEGINAALGRRGRALKIVVTEPPEVGWPTISAQLADGRWLIVPLAVPMPNPGNTWGLIGWILLVALGVTGVMVFAVRRLTEPLALLQRTADAITPCSDVDPLPEKGPAEVRAAARAINQLATRLRQVMESRMRLVAAAGHDLRTPMTRMRLRAEFLAEEERTAFIDDLDELDRIADSAIRLVREEVEDGGGEVLRLDLMVADTAAELREIGCAVTLAQTCPAVIRARPEALRRAMRNLFINAATHGREATVSIVTGVGRVQVLIEDAGPGIPEELLPRVFEPFFRVDPARGAPTPGAGLGLAIAEQIVTRNGGTLKLENMPVGLRQVLEFPVVTLGEGCPKEDNPRKVLRWCVFPG